VHTVEDVVFDSSVEDSCSSSRPAGEPDVCQTIAKSSRPKSSSRTNAYETESHYCHKNKSVDLVGLGYMIILQRWLKSFVARMMNLVQTIIVGLLNWKTVLMMGQTVTQGNGKVFLKQV